MRFARTHEAVLFSDLYFQEPGPHREKDVLEWSDVKDTGISRLRLDVLVDEDQLEASAVIRRWDGGAVQVPASDRVMAPWSRAETWRPESHASLAPSSKGGLSGSVGQVGDQGGDLLGAISSGY